MHLASQLKFNSLNIYTFQAILEFQNRDQKRLIAFSLQPLFSLQFFRQLKYILNISIKIEDYSIYSPLAANLFNNQEVDLIFEKKQRS